MADTYRCKHCGQGAGSHPLVAGLPWWCGESQPLVMHAADISGATVAQHGQVAAKRTAQLHLGVAQKNARSAISAMRQYLDDAERDLNRGGSGSHAASNLGFPLSTFAAASGAIQMYLDTFGEPPT